MPEFFNVLPPRQALETLLRQLPVHVQSEAIATTEALDRVLAQDIAAPEDLPAFPRSTMDGYAVRAQDSFGASEGLPAYFTVVGEVPMGQAPAVAVELGQAVKVHTGGVLPPGSDAVVMVENTQPVDDHTLEVVRAVAPGENVIQVGEDVRTGEQVLPRGHLVRPQDIGGLLALGVTQVPVARRPRVAIVSTGDEIVVPEERPSLGQVRDINTYTASCLTLRAGGIPIPLGVVPDRYDALREAAGKALEVGDILVFSAGSSVSVRDMTADVISSLGEPGILVHGIALRPGKPAIVALVQGKPAFGLPGNPVSAMVVFDLLVRPTIYHLSGCLAAPEPHVAWARLTRDVPSAPGREDFVQVRLERRDGQVCAEPVFGKSNLIYTLVRAHGTVFVPLDRSGLYAGEEVPVRLY